MIDGARLYCGKNMLGMYEVEHQTEYEKSSPLKLLTVDNGIVHPLFADPVLNAMAGGVTDDEGRFIRLSLMKRASPKNFSYSFTDWYCGAGNTFELAGAEYIDEDVVFLGVLPSHYGHFITEGLARLWVFLDPKYSQYKGVYISESETNRFNDCFRFFGLEDRNLIDIKRPTRFRSVIVPEQSIRLHDFYHLKSVVTG